MLPPCIEDYVDGEAPVRFIDAFVAGLDLLQLQFTKARPASTGRPAYDPACLIKLYLYGYLHRIRSSRRLEAECQRNLELIWLMKELQPDFKTISDFRKDNRRALVQLFKEFNLLCRRLDLFGAELVAIDGSKFKALNSPDRNFNAQRLQEALQRIEAGIARHLEALEAADQEAAARPVKDLRSRLALLEERRQELRQLQSRLEEEASGQVSEHDPDSRAMKKVKVGYNVQTAVDSRHGLIVAQEVCQAATDSYRCPGAQTLPFAGIYQKRGKPKRRYENPAACAACALKAHCTTARHRVISRLPNQEVVERSRQRAAQNREVIRQRGALAEHPFGTLKNWGYESFSVTTLGKVRGEFSLMCLSYNLRRVLNLLGVKRLLQALRETLFSFHPGVIGQKT